MKLIKSAVLASLLTITAVQSTQAAVGSMALIVGMYGTSAKYALVGLGWTYAGHKTTPLNEKLGKIALVAGLILLDEETSTVEFKQISAEVASAKRLSLQEANAYNNEIEEINIVFSEVTSQIDEESSESEVEQLWQSHSEFISASAFSALQKIVK